MLTIIFFLLIFLASLIVCVYSQYKNEKRRLINKIPGPKSQPFFGNALMFNVLPDEVWKKIHVFYDLYYPLWKAWIGPIPVVLIRHPDDLQTLLSCKSNINKGKFIYEAASNHKMDGILISGGAKWKHRRKLINPAFSSRLIRCYVDITNDHIKNFAKNLASKGEETVIKLRSLFLLLSVEILCEAAFGVKIKEIFSVEEENELIEAFDEFAELLYNRATKPYIRDWMTKFMRIGTRMKKVMSVFYYFRDKILEEKIKNVELKIFKKLTKSDARVQKTKGNLKGLAILDLLLAARHDELIDDQGMSEEFFIFLSAGSETSGSQIGFTLFLLAENKKAQDLARAEVEKVFNETQGNIGYKEIMKLEYLERCVKESLRVFPTASVISRKISENICFQNYRVPPGTEVIISIYALHRDPNFWPDPNKFDPDRFLPENSKDRHPFAFCPFSAGPRNCIGQKFALLEIQTVVAHMLFNFEIEAISSSSDVEFELNFTLKPKSPLEVKLKRIVRNGKV